MGKKLIITEKPSVAREFAKALKGNFRNNDGYMESEEYIITWCVGHLVTMSYPECYDEALKKWSLQTLPFIPEEYKYQIIDNVKKQFGIIKQLFHRQDVEVIYNAGDSGREGEYIQRLVKQEAGCRNGIEWKRVWIDSQTEEEILRGIREARDESFYDNLSESAYLRAKEDYLMGINFSRVLTLKFGDIIKNTLKLDKGVIAVGRVMTCVQGMVVDREREIRAFEKTPFYKIKGNFGRDELNFTAEWKKSGDSIVKPTDLYKDSGFLRKEKAQEMIDLLSAFKEGILKERSSKKQRLQPPLLFNLAELQNECSKLFKISPDETLKIAQELYEKKLLTYPRTDARVLSEAVTKEIHKNIKGLTGFAAVALFAGEIINNNLHKSLNKKRFVNDKAITDHYAIIPTGQGLGALKALSPTALKVYEVVCRRFLAIFYEAAEFNHISLKISVDKEEFGAGFKIPVKEGFRKVMKYSFAKQKDGEKDNSQKNEKESSSQEDEQEQDICFGELVGKLKKGDSLEILGFDIKEGETAPPKRYNSGSIVLAMENAGQLIEDEELRAQIKGSGIGTSATRAEILKKLVDKQYLNLNKKTQIITPTLMGEAIYECVKFSIQPLLNPTLTASWEKGLTGVANGSVTPKEYTEKMNDFVNRRTNSVKSTTVNRSAFVQVINSYRQYYK